MSFSSLFQLQQTPVTVFRSTDDNAPHLTNAPGALKTILKSCLVTGYGSKTSLGWEMPFESSDGMSAVFKSSDTTASQYCFKIDNSAANAKLSAYKEMTDIDTGTGRFVTDNLYQTQASRWMLIGHGKTFIFIVDYEFKNEQIAYPIVFGDLPRETKRILPVCMMWSARKNLYNSGGAQTTLFGGPAGYFANSSNSSTPQQQSSYPFVISDTSSVPEILEKNTCRFSYDSEFPGSPLFEEPVLCLRDGSWTFLPMLLPLAHKDTAVLNMNTLNATTIKAATGTLKTHNNACAIPIDWWYS